MPMQMFDVPVSGTVQINAASAEKAHKIVNDQLGHGQATITKAPIQCPIEITGLAPVEEITKTEGY